MSHTHAWVLVHCIFSTKERANLIPDPVELCRYLTGVARAKKITLVAAGGTAFPDDVRRGGHQCARVLGKCAHVVTGCMFVFIHVFYLLW